MVQNFVEIALSRTISEINALLHFTQKFKMAAKSGGKVIFCEKLPVDSAYTLWVKNLVEIALSRTVSKINALYAEIQDGCQKWRESNFLTKVARYPVGPNFVEIALSHIFSKINALLHFT